MRKILLLLLILAFYSCGGEPDRVVNNAGTGSNTLKVEAVILAKENYSSAKNPEEFTTEIVIKIMDIQNQGIQDATVIVNAGGKEIIVPHDKNGVYRAGSIVGYDRVYSMDITRGSDSVEGVTVTGPEIHSIKIGNPADTATTVKASSPVTVLWSPYGYATGVEIETKNYKENVADSGTYTIPVGNFVAGGVDYIRITREKSLNPAGALGGSIVTVKIRNRLEPIQVVE